MAICHPFISHTMSKLSRAVKFVVVIWLLALCLAVPQAIQFGIIYEYDNGTAILDSARCSIRWTLIEHAFEISTILFFVLPMTIITVLYVLIGIKLRRSRLLTAAVKRTHVPGGLNHVDSNRGRTAAQRNVIRMLGKSAARPNSPRKLPRRALSSRMEFILQDYRDICGAGIFGSGLL